MIDRLLIALALIAVSFGAYAVGTRWQVSRVARKTGSPLLDGLKAGVPAIIYFWSETCPPCKTVQLPALKQLEAELGPQGIQIVLVNALEQPDVADAWGVLGLPTTFVVDGSGQPRRVNHGVTRAPQLRQQIEALG